MKVLVTGSSGFIAGYLIQHLLDNNYEVMGLDNFSKYGKINKSYDNHPNYQLIKGDVKNVNSGMDIIDEALDKVNCKEKHFCEGNHE